MAIINLTNISKSFGTTKVIDNLDLQVADGEFVVLVGPSGCGKSTLLRMIAGLETPSSGSITINDQEQRGNRRGSSELAMVFQDYALYPHMSIFDNIAFGLQVRGEAKATIKSKVEEVAAMLNLSDYLDRRPKALSGGQRQRVAMGRAIAKGSSTILYDEPLSNLDAKLRIKMRSEIKQFHQQHGRTAIYVTHDQLEAMTLADRLVVLNQGKIEQAGPPTELYQRPATTFVADFLGSPPMNFIDATMVELDGKRYFQHQQVKNCLIPASTKACAAITPGSKVLVGVRPHQLEITSESSPINGEITLIEPTGSSSMVQVAQGDEQLCVEIKDDHHQLKVGDQLLLKVAAANLHLFNQESGIRY